MVNTGGNFLLLYVHTLVLHAHQEISTEEEIGFLKIEELSSSCRGTFPSSLTTHSYLCYLLSDGVRQWICIRARMAKRGRGLTEVSHVALTHMGCLTNSYHVERGLSPLRETRWACLASYQEYWFVMLTHRASSVVKKFPSFKTIFERIPLSSIAFGNFLAGWTMQNLAEAFIAQQTYHPVHFICKSCFSEFFHPTISLIPATT